MTNGPGFFILVAFICFAIWACFELFTTDNDWVNREYFIAMGVVFIIIGVVCGGVNPGIALLDVAKVVFVTFILAAMVYQLLSKE